MLELGGDAALASFLWMLVCVVLIIGLAYWFTKYVAGRGALGAFSGGRRMEVLDRLPLGRDQNLILARVGERYLLLGAGTAGHRSHPAGRAHRRGGRRLEAAGNGGR